jgi:hypothetical protein
MAEEFFKGKTQAGRVLRLFYEHLAFDSFTDAAGEPVETPTETKYTGTLDDAPIEIRALNWSQENVTVVSDRGTFTATSTDSETGHSDALRRYLEQRPSSGWQVEVVDKTEEREGWRYMVTITNGRLTERADFWLSRQVAETLARGGPLPPPNEDVARQISQTVRSDTWERVKHRAENPTEIIWLAHPT